MTQYVLIAGIEDWMAIIVPVASIVIYVINQLFDKSAQQQQPPRRRVETDYDRDRENEQPDDEVERMVREALERSRERQSGGNRPAAPRPASPAPSRQRVPQWRAEVIEAEVVEEPRSAQMARSAQARAAEPRRTNSGGGIAAHVDQYLGEHERQFTQAVAANVSTDDVVSHLDEHVHATFDHQVGSFDSPGGAGPSAAGQQPSNPLMALFAQPDTFRQAFILQDILDPPRSL